jgi:hypothetical protein
MNIKVSGICQAFDASCIGTKVTDKDAFMAELSVALAAYTMPANGQGYVVLSSVVEPIVLSGDCERAGLTEQDYVVREWRGEVQLFAKRREQRTAFCAAIVYTAEAYCTDPQVDDAERERIAGATHVLVAVLGSRGPKPTLSSSRFVRNLAGGNTRWLDKKSDDDLINEAKAIAAHEAAWVVVADPAP